MIDLTNIPEDFDWRTAYINLNDKYHADKAPESDLDALKSFDSLMLEMANSTVCFKQ